MERRNALRIITVGVLAERMDAVEHLLFQVAKAPETYKLQFFTPAQDEMIATLAEMIIPKDDHSPGAREAKVSYFIDLIVANSAKSVQDDWTRGLKLFTPFSKRKETMAAAAANETKPTTDLERFFVQLKQMTINGYYTSSIGIHRELKYIGNTALSNYNGCTHPEHLA